MTGSREIRRQNINWFFNRRCPRRRRCGFVNSLFTWTRGWSCGHDAISFNCPSLEPWAGCLPKPSRIVNNRDVFDELYDPYRTLKFPYFFCSLTLFVIVALLDSFQPLLSLLVLLSAVSPWVPSLISLVVSSHCSFVASSAACLILCRPLLLPSGCLLFFVPSWDLWLVRCSVSIMKCSFTSFLNLLSMGDYFKQILP